MGLPADVGMNGDRHHFHPLLTFLVQLIEGFREASEPVVALMLMDHHDRNVVVLHRVGQCDQRAVLRGDTGRLVVINPVAYVAKARGRQIVRRLKRLGQARP